MLTYRQKMIEEDQIGREQNNDQDRIGQVWSDGYMMVLIIGRIESIPSDRYRYRWITIQIRTAEAINPFLKHVGTCMDDIELRPSWFRIC